MRIKLILQTSLHRPCHIILFQLPVIQFPWEFLCGIDFAFVNISTSVLDFSSGTGCSEKLIFVNIYTNMISIYKSQ